MPKKKYPFDLGEDFSLVRDDSLLIKLPEHKDCDHGVVFDEEEFNKHPNMSASEVRKRWPRGWGICPKGCGFNGIAYASFLHYIAGDW